LETTRGEPINGAGGMGEREEGVMRTSNRPCQSEEELKIDDRDHVVLFSFIKCILI